MTDSRTDRVTVVVGGTSGIGLATARELAGRGDTLVLVAREGGSFDAAADLVRTAGAADVTCLRADINDDMEVGEMVAAVLQRHGRIDALVHTATVMAYGTIEQLPTEVFESVVDTAIHGTASLARAVLPVMRRQNHGVFVIVNSLLGSITVPTMGAYATAKWGQRAIARTLQQEVQRERDLHVCIVSPGSINTPIYYQAANFLGREARPPIPVLQPAVAGQVISRLLDHPRKHVSIPVGPVNPLAIFGYRFLPAVFDAIVWPLFRLAALTARTTGPEGNTARAVPEQEEIYGRWPDKGQRATIDP